MLRRATSSEGGAKDILGQIQYAFLSRCGFSSLAELADEYENSSAMKTCRIDKLNAE